MAISFNQQGFNSCEKRCSFKIEPKLGVKKVRFSY